MNDSSNKRSSGKIPSEEQMDGLLKDFFKLETPSGLNRPFRRPVVSRQESTAASVVTLPTSETTAAPRSHKMVVASAIAVLAMSLIVAMKVQKPTTSGGNTASTTPKAQSAEPAERLMLVSPNGDARSTQAVGEDGLTLEETDSIELKPQKHSAEK
ncbi:MAG: hypothetical protein U0936_15790 [Planctomycetaceae bacterium]